MSGLLLESRSNSVHLLCVRSTAVSTGLFDLASPADCQFVTCIALQSSFTSDGFASGVTA